MRFFPYLSSHLHSFSPVYLSFIFSFSHTSSLHWSSQVLRSILAVVCYFNVCAMHLYHSTIGHCLRVCFYCLCVCATHCTQCCAYWMHLPRCTLNELWLLMNGGTVEERTKNSMIIHRNWPSPRYYCVLEFSFVFFSCSFSFIYFHFFSLFLHFVQPTKMANSIEKKTKWRKRRTWNNSILIMHFFMANIQ